MHAIAVAFGGAGEFEGEIHLQIHHRRDEAEVQHLVAAIGIRNAGGREDLGLRRRVIDLHAEGEAHEAVLAERGVDRPCHQFPGEPCGVDRVGDRAEPGVLFALCLIGKRATLGASIAAAEHPVDRGILAEQHAERERTGRDGRWRFARSPWHQRGRRCRGARWSPRQVRLSCSPPGCPWRWPRWWCWHPPARSLANAAERAAVLDTGGI